MKFLFIINDKLDPPGILLDYMRERSHEYCIFNAFEGNDFPQENYEVYVIMGNPDSVNDEKDYIKKEKIFIKALIDQQKTIIGFCWGAQILSLLLGGKVYPNHVSEFGVFDLHIAEQGKDHPLVEGWPDTIPTFQSHKETFDIPEEAIHLFSSKDCVNQAFIKENILAMQFHWEVTDSMVRLWIDKNKEKLLKKGRDVDLIWEEYEKNKAVFKEYLFSFLDRFLQPK